MTWYTYVVRCAIWHHLYNFKNVKNTRGGVLILVKLQTEAYAPHMLIAWYKLATSSILLQIIQQKPQNKWHIFYTGINRFLIITVRQYWKWCFATNFWNYKLKQTISLQCCLSQILLGSFLDTLSHMKQQNFAMTSEKHLLSRRSHVFRKN